MILQQTKLLSGIETIHKKFTELTDFDEKFNMLTLEGCFKI